MKRLELDDNFTVEDITRVDIKVHKIYLERDRVSMIAKAATQMFFIIITLSMVGVLKSLLTLREFWFLLFMSVSILLIASHPYMKSLKEEQDFLEAVDEKLSEKVKKPKVTRKNLRRN